VNQREYTHRPLRKSKGAAVLGIGLLIASVFSLLLSEALGPFRYVGTLLCAVFLFLSVQIISKFVLTEFCYAWKDGILSLYRIFKGQSRLFGRISLRESECVLLMSKKEWKRKKEKTSFQRVFCYQNLFSPDVCVLWVQKEEASVALFFEPDSTLKEVLSSCISQPPHFL